MANPTHRHTKSRRDKRRANWKGKLPTLAACPDCKELKEPHRACINCGSYNGKKVLEVVSKKS
ncbi:MAG: 50S ribosomal protein L32 [Nitrospirae bacterium]|nr:50S ribosomal protein L32 [Nitrospirota bacterium]MCL5236826.1 50S ribosomal protein L32 [Nitrospirota bacterium]